MTMKIFTTITFVALSATSGVTAFHSAGNPSAKGVFSAEQSATALHEYIPNGMSKEQWYKIKDKEANKNKGKNLGKSGITSFKSRSFAEWQKAGGKNLFPVDPRTVKDPKDLPYMQRAGGSANNEDLSPKKGGFFSIFNKKKEPEPEPEPQKKQNPWTF